MPCGTTQEIRRFDNGQDSATSRENAVTALQIGYSTDSSLCPTQLLSQHDNACASGTKSGLNFMCMNRLQFTSIDRTALGYVAQFIGVCGILFSAASCILLMRNHQEIRLGTENMLRALGCMVGLSTATQVHMLSSTST